MKNVKLKVVIGGVVLLGLGACASTSSVSNNPAFAANKDRVVYMRVFGIANETTFGYDGAIKNLCQQGDSRCASHKDYQMAWGMPRNSYWAGNVKFSSLVPLGVLVNEGDILEVRLPEMNRPTYFLRVVSHENDPNPVCKWDGALTSGGVVCPSLGYDYRKHLGIDGDGAGGIKATEFQPYTPPAKR